MVQYLAKTIVRGAVDSRSVCGRFRSSKSYDVVFAEEARLKSWTIDEDGAFEFICEQPVFGTIQALAVLPWTEIQNLGKDFLLVNSDSKLLSVLQFENEFNRFVPVSHVQFSYDVRDRMLAVDSTGSFIAAACAFDFKRNLAFFSLSPSVEGDIFAKRFYCCLPSNLKQSGAGFISGMCFISKDVRPPINDNPVLAILLNGLGEDRTTFILIEWNIQANSVKVIYENAAVGTRAHHITEVPRSFGLLVVFKAGGVILVDCKNPDEPCVLHDIGFNFTSSIEPSTCRVSSWSWAPENKINSPRMLFSASSGEIFLMEIDYNARKMHLSGCLYKTLSAKALLWVEDGLLVAIFERSDGIVLKVEGRGLRYSGPILHIAPILDMSLVNYHNNHHDQMFVCCGEALEGSLLVMHGGISVKKLLTTPNFKGITGIWAVKKKLDDLHHSFLVLSFSEETRVLAVGLTFSDVTDTVGFLSRVCTLTCGLVSDGLLVQVCQNSVRVVLVVDDISSSQPILKSWSPDNNVSISLGVVGRDLIIVSTSCPCILFILSVRSLAADSHEIYQVHNVRHGEQLSCISIPQKWIGKKLLSSTTRYGIPAECNIFVIGTYKPAVEVLSFTSDTAPQVIAVGSLTGSVERYIPQDVRLVLADQPYILLGVRNGMILRFEWPSAPTVSSMGSHGQQTSFAACSENFQQIDCPLDLQLISEHRIGIGPASLISLDDSINADFFVLSDRPWLVQTARPSLLYAAIGFPPTTHATPIYSTELTRGAIFVSEDRLHLVELSHCNCKEAYKKLTQQDLLVPSFQKFKVGGTPRKIFYPGGSRLMLILRTDLDDGSSDVCCVDCLSGSVSSLFRFEQAETGKCMELVEIGGEKVLIVGTGGSEIAHGRILVLRLEHNMDSREESEACRLQLDCSNNMDSGVRSVCRFLDQYFLASCGNQLLVCGFTDGNSQRIEILATGFSVYDIVKLSAHSNIIALGDCRGYVSFYSYREDLKELKCISSCHVEKFVDCILMDENTAAVSDETGSLLILSNLSQSGAGISKRILVTSSFFIGEKAVRMLKGSFSKLSAEDPLNFMASTEKGSLIEFISLTKEEYDILKILQDRLQVHQLTAPILGNTYGEYHSRGSWASSPKMLDGDMLAQFLHLSETQQGDVFAALLTGPAACFNLDVVKRLLRLYF